MSIICQPPSPVKEKTARDISPGRCGFDLDFPSGGRCRRAYLAAAAFLLPVDRSVSAALALFLLSPVSGLGPVYTFKLAPELLNDSSMCICLSILASTAIYLVLIPPLLQYAL